MGILPPKHHDLKSFFETTDSEAIEKSEVWEICVPPGNSLYWSIVLSYLLSSNDEEFPIFLDNLTNIENKADEKRIQKRIQAHQIDFRQIRKRVKNFNPFKNRYVFFFDEKMIDVLRTFKWKLNNFAEKVRPDKEQWNSETKLNAASSMLNCKIDIYYPDETENRVVLYPERGRGRLHSKIILFQYKDQKHGSRKENINVFRFAISADYCYVLKISALSFILKKAKFSKEDSSRIKRLMFEPKAHGKSFLPTILQSPYFRLMADMYKSPYIALKLSEAGFETNPVEINPGEPSSLFLSMAKASTKYARILYDYSVNCRYLFDRSVREADETVLDSLRKVHDIFEKDKANLHILDIDTSIKERALNIQSEFTRFNEYQQNIASTIRSLRLEINNESSNREIVRIRKKVTERLLESYLEFFYYNLPEKIDVCDTYHNYLSYTEYYENADCFTCLSFFDNIYILKKMFQLKEDIYANIESSFFLLLISNKYFPKFKHAIRCNSEHDATDCERKKNVSRFIPLLYREKLNIEINNFLNKLKYHKESPVPQDKKKEKKFCNSLASLPEIRDELLISRIQKYLKTALKVSFEEDGIKGIFVIERALQVLGESLKPQSTEGCVVSCLLGSRLPNKLKQKIINIRDDLSHYRDSSVHGRLSSEEDRELFEDLQKELSKIMESFEIVAFTQYLRLEESLMDKSLQELENYRLDQNIIKKFVEENKARLHNRKITYVKYHSKCIKLSLEVVDDIRCYLEENTKKKLENERMLQVESNIIRKLKSLEYVFLLMQKLINDQQFQTYLEEIKCYRENFIKDKKINSLRYDIELFRNKYIEAMTNIFKIENFSSAISENLDLQYPKLEAFLDYMKKRVTCKSDVKSVTEIAKIIYDEAIAAREELKNYIKLGSFSLSEREELLLQKLIISQESLKKLRRYFETMDKKLAWKELDKKWILKDSFVKKVQKSFQENCVDTDVKTVFIKIAYQKHLPTKIYSSAKLSDQMCSEIDDILKKKARFLLSRINDIQAILINENDEIKEAWNWGRSKAIRYHMKFLMRQRFIMEMPVRASLEIALLDCLNILEREDFKDVYEKLHNIFTGINLRNVLSHGHSILETVGGLLDEDDLPSELITKMLNLVEDSDTITKMQELIPHSGTLEKETFKTWIKDYEDEDEDISNQIKNIRKCPRWTNYLFLLPLI